MPLAKPLGAKVTYMQSERNVWGQWLSGEMQDDETISDTEFQDGRLSVRI
jgi:hypothetical protein